MLRCRECNGFVNEDFVLAETVVAVEAPAHQCAKCGAALESASADCPACASAMLDQLLSATPEGAGDVPSRRMPPPPPPGVSRLRDYTPAAPIQREEAEEPSSRGRAPEKDSPSRGGRKAKRRSGAAKTSPDDDEAGTDALYESETDVRSSRSSTTEPEIDRPTAEADADESSAIPEEAASAACKSLLAALATPDAEALSQVVTALGKLGDRSAIGPLERLMVNPEIRVRRAAAEALIALGHPKGKALLDIAERKVAALPASAGPAYSKPKAKRSSAPIDWGAMLKPGLAVVGVAILGSGIWWWQSKPSAPKVAKKVSSAKAAAQERLKKAQQPPPSTPSGPSAFDN